MKRFFTRLAVVLAVFMVFGTAYAQTFVHTVSGGIQTFSDDPHISDFLTGMDFSYHWSTTTYRNSSTQMTVNTMTVSNGTITKGNSKVGYGMVWAVDSVQGTSASFYDIYCTQLLAPPYTIYMYKPLNYAANKSPYLEVISEVDNCADNHLQSIQAFYVK